MFSRPFVRVILTAALAAILLVPAAQADGWGRDNAAQLDPAIAAAVQDRASAVVQPSAALPVRAHAVLAVRPDDRAGLRGAGTTPSTPVALSDAVERAVLRHNGSTAVRPDDRAGPRGAGTRVADNAPITTAASAGFHWADAGFGAAATLALILVLAGLALARAKHHRSHPILN